MSADVVICGAGIAGLAAAYHLAVRCGVRSIMLVDERDPLSLTSDKSTEAYRNWWPGPDDAMIRLMNRSIDLLEALAHETGNRFLMNRRGYVYATSNPARVAETVASASRASAMGAGPVRIHDGRADTAPYIPSQPEGFENAPEGADLILERGLIAHHFPYLSESVVAVLHTRRCGWLSGQQLGMVLLEQAQARGVRLIRARVEGISTSGGRVQAVRIAGGSEASAVETPCFVNAAGPMVSQVAALLGIDLPVFSERHLKVSLRDHLGVIPREAPLVIWDDPQILAWSDEERAALAESDDTARLLGVLPSGVHARPEGGGDSQNILILWPYDAQPAPVVFPVPGDPLLPEVALRGMAALIPGLRAYFDQIPRPFVDGGYYTKTAENRLLSCPLPVDGAYLIGALSGFGLMASLGAGELLAAAITGAARPAYAPAFHLDRYRDPAYLKRLEDWGATGQL